MSLPFHVNIMVGRRDLQRFVLDAGEGLAMPLDLGEKMKVLENARIMSLSLLGTEIWGSCWKISFDFTTCLEKYKYRGAQTRDESLWSFVRSAS
ncbi:hypothetical protein AVEN_96623-1 [Araneus ventricosus]|uniref:Uncharacterized protein n=1 Tax=Araneus ventricosus TaxID=182803 RepID=A0A4Y2LUB8_ARAVE|nr:hypothetical protein AVEN_174580-1 [Araneus ventricosus]GBN18368.1 hypothetical protein AVEN_167559-1 [Araneus ventricosus]GBN19528.1 hypothetical protein AVEN_96623-1 [Araneus ventricosus]